MFELPVGQGLKEDVLISKYNGKLYATGAYCTYSGAPLSKGVLVDDKVLCSTSGSGFSVTTGALEYVPSQDGIPIYEITQKDGKSFVRVPKKMEQKQVAKMATRDKSNQSRFVIVGNGLAGLSCAETLRQSNFTGEIMVLSSENMLPYDQSLLSKLAASVNAEKLIARGSDFLDEYGIDYYLNQKIGSIEPGNKSVRMEDGYRISYDKLLLANGEKFLWIDHNIKKLKNILTLSTTADYHKIKELSSTSKDIVIVGDGLANNEIASSLATILKGKSNVTLVCDGESPIERRFGKEVNGMIKGWHQENGVKVI